MEIMALWLDRHGVIDGGIKQRVIIVTAHEIAQIDLVILTQAQIEPPRRRQPDTIAAVAEILGQRRDQAKPAPGLLDPEVTRRPPGAMVVGNQRTRPL